MCALVRYMYILSKKRLVVNFQKKKASGPWLVKSCNGSLPSQHLYNRAATTMGKQGMHRMQNRATANLYSLRPRIRPGYQYQQTLTCVQQHQAGTMLDSTAGRPVWPQAPIVHLPCCSYGQAHPRLPCCVYGRAQRPRACASTSSAISHGWK
jgi:hypothetical protein